MFKQRFNFLPEVLLSVFSRVPYIFLQPSRENYRKVFAVAAGLCAFGGTFFMVFLSGEEQSWNNPDSTKRLENESKEQEMKGVENTTYQMDATNL